MVNDLEWCTISLSSTLVSDTDLLCRVVVVVVGLHIHRYIVIIQYHHLNSKDLQQEYATHYHLHEIYKYLIMM